MLSKMIWRNFPGGSRLPLSGVWVLSLARELRSHMHVAWPGKKKKDNIEIHLCYCIGNVKTYPLFACGKTFWGRKVIECQSSILAGDAKVVPSHLLNSQVLAEYSASADEMPWSPCQGAGLAWTPSWGHCHFLRVVSVRNPGEIIPLHLRTYMTYQCIYWYSHNHHPRCKQSGICFVYLCIFWA